MLRFLLFVIFIFIPLNANCEMIDNGDETLLDTSNMVEWTQHVIRAKRTFDAATSHAASFEWRGRGEWRLPTKTELESLVDDTYDPEIDPLFDMGPGPAWDCWTSTETTVGSDVLSSKAWFVYFGDGQSFKAPQLTRHSALYVNDTTFIVDTDGNYILDTDGNYIRGTE